MEMVKKIFLFLLLIFMPISQLVAQQEVGEPVLRSIDPEKIVSKQGYAKTAPAIVKIVSEGGRKMAAGVILGVSEDGDGYVLTSFGAVAGLNKVAVILMNHPTPFSAASLTNGLTLI